jgi:hypothetical protein
MPERADLQDAIAPDGRSPQVAPDLPGAAGEILIPESQPALEDQDAVAAFREAHGRHASAEARSDDDVVVGLHAEA